MTLHPVLEGTQTGPRGEVVIEWNRSRLDRQIKDGDAVGMKEEMLEIGTARYGRAATEASLLADIRTLISPDGWKLNYSSTGQHELFYLEDDPRETQNRIADPTVQDTVAHLTDRLLAWRTATGDDLPPWIVPLPGVRMWDRKGAIWPESVTRQYSHVRPHSSLNYRLPAPVVIKSSVAAAS